MRLVIQAALEAEVSEFLGRERYARAAASPQGPRGQPQWLLRHHDQDHPGPVTLARPKLRNATEAFVSRLLGTGVTKTHALESLSPP